MNQDGADHQPGAEVSGSRSELAQTRTTFAEDRTSLASERSLLAWFRTAFGAYALSLGFGRLLPSLGKTNPTLGNVYVVIGACFALLGAGFAVDGFQRYRRFIHILDMPSTPHQRSEMGRLTVAGVVIAVLGVATALMIVINRFALSGRSDGS
jgi:putative membrane protein